MSDLPIEVNKKLNIWKELRVRLYLLRKYSPSRFAKVPKDIKQDDRVIKHRIKGELSLPFPNNADLLDIFIQRPELFDENSKNQLVEYAIKEGRYEVISVLDEKEQYKIITENRYDINILKFASSNTIKELINNRAYSDPFKVGNGNSFLEYCSVNVQIELMRENRELITSASIDSQVEYLKQDNTEFELMCAIAQEKFLENNLEFLNTHKEYALKASRETQMLFASQEKENLKYIEEEYQIEIIEKYPTAFEYASKKIKKLIFDSKRFEYTYNRNPFSIINSLLNQDMKYFKYINFETADQYLNSLINNIKDMDYNKIKEIIIKSGILSAKGNLRRRNSSYFEGYESVLGQDIYSNNQLALIQTLNVEQISDLIKIDTNYIMSYVRVYNIQEKNVEETYKKRCKQVFLNIYGEKKFKELEKCIDDIFDAQTRFLKEKNKVVYFGNNQSYYADEYEIPLESLKLLFNQEVINSNSPELIQEYYSKLFSNEDESKVFKQVILNTYGESAIEILDDRKNLDIYGINSLEVFDQRILENFSKEFVNDLLSYNIRDFSAFLNIIKNERELSLFKEYYNLLSKVTGKNVETMQKAISEFYYNKDLLENIKNVELSEEEYTNLIVVLCGNKNSFNIKTVNELNRFDEIANKDFNENLSAGLNTINDIILNNLFGINSSFIEYLVDIYDLQTDDNMMSQEEKDVIECINFIRHEYDETKLLQLAKELMNKPGIRNPIALYSGISKVKEKGIKIFERRMLTKDKLDEICADKEEDGIRKENIEGVEVYYFEGFRLNGEIGFLGHDDVNANGRDIMEYEGQAGMSTISTRLYMDEQGLINDKPHYLFTDIEKEDLFAYLDDDANVNHSPKLVTSTRKIRGQEGMISDTLENCCNEVAFYRRTRNHDKRDSNNPSGRIKPTYILVVNKMDSSIKGIPASDLEYAKKYNIPIIVIEEQSYIRREIKKGGIKLDGR